MNKTNFAKVKHKKNDSPAAADSADADSDTVIACRGVAKSFAAADGRQSVLDDINLTVKSRQSLAIAGVSGSGKTTLLHLLGGLDRPSAGKVFVCGRDLATMDDKQTARWRNEKLGFVFQFHLLLPEFSALENTAMPLLIRRMPRAKSLAAAMEKLSLLGLEKHAHKTPEKLSGGERQRVAVARALAGNPVCILADEPTGNLDRKNADAVFAALLLAVTNSDAALIMVSHDDKLAARAEKQLRLVDGKLRSAE